MIVKVQIPLMPPDGPALVYSEGRKNYGLMAQDALPDAVRAAAKGGKAYFYAQMIGGRMRFHKQAPSQEW